MCARWCFAAMHRVTCNMTTNVPRTTVHYAIRRRYPEGNRVCNNLWNFAINVFLFTIVVVSRTEQSFDCTLIYTIIVMKNYCSISFVYFCRYRIKQWLCYTNRCLYCCLCRRRCAWCWDARPRINIKSVFLGTGISIIKSIVRPSYLYNGNSYAGKMAFSYLVQLLSSKYQW